MTDMSLRGILRRVSEHACTSVDVQELDCITIRHDCELYLAAMILLWNKADLRDVLPFELRRKLAEALMAEEANHD
jgi:hypothetical protein